MNICNLLKLSCDFINILGDHPILSGRSPRLCVHSKKGLRRAQRDGLKKEPEKRAFRESSRER